VLDGEVVMEELIIFDVGWIEGGTEGGSVEVTT
jgi:hypothetical protein